MNALQTAAFDALSENGYTVTRDEEEGILLIRSQLELPSGSIEVVFDASDGTIFTVSLVPSLIVPADKLYMVMEFIHRVNWMFALGHLEIDPNDGQLRFIHTQLTLRESMTHEELLTIIRSGIERIETFYPGLVAIIEKNFHAVVALDHVTQPDDHISHHHGRYLGSSQKTENKAR